MSWIRAFAAAIPRIRATESLRRALEVAVGTGSMGAEDSRSVRSEWERDASAAPRRRTSVGEARALASTFGFAVVEEKKA